MLQPDNSASTWDRFLSGVAERISTKTFNTWFANLSFQELRGSTLVAVAPESYFVDYVIAQFSSEINEALAEALGHPGHFKIIQDGQAGEEHGLLPAESQIPSLLSVENREPELESPAVWTSLNPKYRFDNFIEGDGNRMARSAALACANNPGQTIFNPLFIHGDVGLGKTHLIQAIGNLTREKFPNYRVLYLSGDSFYRHFIETLKQNRSVEFASLYRNVNVLILDDIQFLKNKNKTQIEFFHTFNTLFQAGRQIVLSSDRPPRDLEGMEFRLISRLGSGFTIDLQPLDLETRMAILKHRADESSTHLPEEVIRYIATHITSNIRELERALIQVLAQSSLSGQPVSLTTARKALKRIIHERPRTISVDHIQKIVADYYDVPDTKLRDKIRTKRIAEARHVAMYLAHRLTNSTRKDIGLFFGGKDHSTVIYAIKTVEKRLEANDGFRLALEDLTARIRNTIG